MDSKLDKAKQHPTKLLTSALNPSRKSSDLSEIEPVIREEDYKDPGEEVDGRSVDSRDKGDRLLSAIFSRPDIHSAHEHDAILATNRISSTNEPNAEKIAREARRLAAQAAKELQRANEIARTLPAGVPTWTGVFGTAGYEEEPVPRSLMSRRGGLGSAGRGGRPSSSSILANLAARQGNALDSVGGSGESSRTTTPIPHHPRGKDFMVMIRDFLKSHGGSCVTQNLIDHFNRFCGTPQRTAEFKEMLSRIAVLQKGSRARGKWVLKKEFGGTA
jgi:DNA excision repair protein ERCC-6